MSELAASEPGQLRSEQHHGRRRGSEERIVEGQLEHLIVSCARDFFAAVAYVHAPEARHAIEQLATVRVINAAAFGADDDAAATELLHQSVVLLRRKMMRE